MFTPKYSITDRLLANIKHVNRLVQELNDKRFPDVVLLEFERTARAVSTYASTSIEGNPLPLTEVKKILKSSPVHIRDSEKEILNYNRALQKLNSQLAQEQVKLNLELVLAIQKQVTQGLLAKKDNGHLRAFQVVVNDPRNKEIVYLPPESSEVKRLMQELLEFASTQAVLIDPLILAGIFHKQMVIIHPFMDGNGRTTRLATKVLLAKMGLNTFNLFSFENYYNQNVTKYFRLVGEYGNYYDLVEKVDFTPWLEYFTEGIIDELLRVQKLLPTNITPKTQLQSFHTRVLEYIKKNGFIRDSDYSVLTKRAKATRAKDFKKLIELELIEKHGKSRATYYTLKE